MKTIICLALLSLLVGSAFGTAQTASSTAASFNSTPVKVFDSTNTTTTAPATQNDGTFTAAPVTNQVLAFGPGTDNTTIAVWAIKYSATNVFSGVIRRTLNATQVALGTGTAEESVYGTDTAITLGTTVTLRTNPVVGTGLAAILGVAGVMGPAAQPGQDVLNLWTYSGTSLSQTIAVATAVVSTSSALNTFITNAVWSEDGYFYILYETVQIAGTFSSLVFTPTNANSQSVSAVTLQAFGATNGTKLWTTAPAIATSLTGASLANYVTSTMAMGSGTNYSGSANIQVLYKDVGVSPQVVKYVVTPKTAAGTAGSATVVGTDAAGTSTTANNMFYPGGFIGTNYTYGFLVSNVTRANTAATSYATGIMASLNGTTASATQLAITLGSGQTPISFMGYRYGTGFAGIINTPVTAGNSYSWQTYFANGTVNATASAAIGTSKMAISQFVDMNGALWVGYYSYDDAATTGVTTGYVGRLVSQLNYYNATSNTTKAANVLATFAAILSFVIASLFMF